MNGRERLAATLNHQQPDRVCVDFGSTPVTGIHVSAVDRLRKRLLGDPQWRVKVIEPYQFLGEIDDQLREAMGVDVIGALARRSKFASDGSAWKPFTMFDGTEVQIHANLVIREEEGTGDLLAYPQGDTSVPPSGRMPRGGLFFDAIIRQDPIDEDRLDPADNCEEFTLLGDDDLAYYRAVKQRFTEQSQYGTMLIIPGAAFGDIALVPAGWLKHPKGIRDIQEWYISTVTRKPYIRAVFERQCEIALQNINTLIDLFGDTVQAAFISGTDFGTQRGLFCSVATYRELYKPFHIAVNKLIHERTNWKTFIHTCGSVWDLLPDLVEAGFDILNPVQCSAAKMDPVALKREFGKQLVFWGGGVDTQKTLPFGTPEEVYNQVRERIAIFNDGGGFVFNTIHNIQGDTPVENILALLRAIADSHKG